jgi:nucleotide-binding universal stress UspA family protein
MFHKILVGTDGRDGGLDAVALACRLLAPDGELLLAHIHHGYPIAAKLETGEYERAAWAAAHALLARAGEQTGMQSLLAHGATSVGRGLDELAERESADLVVIGATRRSPITHMFAGDVTRETLRAARGAVAVAPVGYADRPNPIRSVAVAYDATHESRAAAAVAKALAGALDARLSAIQVLELPSYIIYSDRIRADDHAEASATVDLLVMGSRSLGPVAKLLHSSRSQHLAGRANCPLLVMPEVASDAYRRENRTDQPVPV